MGVQASPTYYLAFWLGSPLPNHIQPWLIAHFLLIKSLFQLSLSCLEFLIFRFAEKSQSFFLVWVSSQDVFLTSLFLLVKSPCSPVNFIPWAPGAPPREIQQPFRREARQAIGAHEEQLLEEPRTGPTGTVAAGDPLLAKLKCLVSSMDWFKIYGKP